MKNLSSALLLIILFVVVSGFNPTKKEKGRIEVQFNRNFKFNDLVKVKLDMAEKGIALNYQLLEFDDNGGLKSITFKVDCNDSFSGGASSNLIYTNTKFGFYRDYNNVVSPFGVGNLE